MKRFKPKTRFGQAMALIVFAVVFSAFFNNIEPLWDLVKKLVALLNPLWVLIFFGEVPGIYALLGGCVVIATVTLWCILGDKQKEETA